MRTKIRVRRGRAGQSSRLQVGREEIALDSSRKRRAGTSWLRQRSWAQSHEAQRSSSADSLASSQRFERDDRARGGLVMRDGFDGKLDAPESQASRTEHVHVGVEFFYQQAGQLGGRADAAEQGGEGTLISGVLIEEHANDAPAAEDFQRPHGRALSATPGILARRACRRIRPA